MKVMKETPLIELVRHGFLTREGVIAKLREGWQLGRSNGLSSHTWVQERLCCGGNSLKIRANTFQSMVERREVVALPRQPQDAYWLSRYGLPFQQTGNSE